MFSNNLTMMTDLYELTMMQGYFKSQNQDVVVFDAFYRENPCGGGYAIACGLEQVIEYIKNLRAQQWCSDAIGRALDDSLFWNNLAGIYLDADLHYDCRKCLSMAEDILEGITGRSDRTSFYIPRGN